MKNNHFRGQSIGNETRTVIHDKSPVIIKISHYINWSMNTYEINIIIFIKQIKYKNHFGKNPDYRKDHQTNNHLIVIGCSPSFWHYIATILLNKNWVRFNHGLFKHGTRVERKRLTGNQSGNTWLRHHRR